MVEDRIDSFSRPTELWSMAGREIANFVVDVHTDSTGADMEYTYAKTKKELATELKSYTSAETHEFGIFVDGMEYSEWMYAYGHTDELLPATTDIDGFFAVMDTQNDGDFLPSNNGVLTQVFVTDQVKYLDGQGNEQGHQGKVYVTCVNTYLGEVRNVVDHETGEYTTSISFFDEVLNNSKGEPVGLTLPNLNMVEGLDGEFEVDDIVIVQASAYGMSAKAGGNDGVNGDMTLVTVNTPETVTGFVTESTLTADYVGGLSLKIDDVEFEYSIGSRGEIVFENEMTPSVGTELTAYFDANVGPDGSGYILGYEAVETAPQYLYVEGSDGDGWTFIDGSTCQVTFADGEEKVIQISHIDGEKISSLNYTDIPNSNRFYDADKNQVSANENFYTDEDGVIYFDQIENRIFGWEYYADTDTYNITTDIQKEFNYKSGKSDFNASEGGLLASSVGGVATTGATSVYNQYGTLEHFNNGSGLTDNGSPVKDTMAVFTSVYIPGTTEIAPGGDNEGNVYATDQVAIKDENGDIVDFRTVNFDDEVAYHNNNISDSTYWNFALKSDNSTAFAVQSPTEGTKTYADKNAEVNASGTGTSDATKTVGTFGSNDIGDKDINYKYDHVFSINSNTVIVDVVNNTIWQGTSDKEFKDLTDGNLNMQVLFGNSGVANTIFINNGVADPTSADKHFILMDDSCKEYVEDGVTYFDYNVYIDGVADVITSKNKELEVTNAENHIYADTDTDDFVEKLQINTLYRITEKDDDGYVRKVDLKYDYSPITEVRYDHEEQETLYIESKTDSNAGYTEGTYMPHEVYNNLWTVAKVASGGLLELWHDDQFVNQAGAYDAGLFDKDGVPGENYFWYDDDTVFVYMEANKDGDISTVRAASVDDIDVYRKDKTGYAHNWVDVVVADYDVGRNPYAELVVIVEPYGNKGYEGSDSNTPDKDAIGTVQAYSQNVADKKIFLKNDLASVYESAVYGYTAIIPVVRIEEYIVKSGEDVTLMDSESGTIISSNYVADTENLGAGHFEVTFTIAKDYELSDIEMVLPYEKLAGINSIAAIAYKSGDAGTLTALAGATTSITSSNAFTDLGAGYYSFDITLPAGVNLDMTQAAADLVSVKDTKGTVTNVVLKSGQTYTVTVLAEDGGDLELDVNTVITKSGSLTTPATYTALAAALEYDVAAGEIIDLTVTDDLGDNRAALSALVIGEEFNVVIGATQTDTGALTVDGALTFTGTFTAGNVGAVTGTGTVTVKDNYTITDLASVAMGDSAVFTVSESVITGVAGGFVMGATATLTITGSTVTPGNGISVGANSTVTVDGSAVDVTGTTALALGSQLVVDNGSDFTATDMTFAGNTILDIKGESTAEINAAPNLVANSTLNLADGSTLDIGASGAAHLTVGDGSEVNIDGILNCTNIVNTAGGTLNITGNAVVNTLGSLSGTFNFQSGSEWVLDAECTPVDNTVITLGGTLDAESYGLTLTGTNTKLILDGGTVELGNTIALVGANATSVTGAGKIEMGDAAILTAVLTTTGDLTENNSSTATVDLTSANGVMTAAVTGDLAVGATDAMTANITMTTGTLEVPTDATLSTGAFTLALGGAGVLDISDTRSNGAALSVSATGGKLTLALNSEILVNNGTFTSTRAQTIGFDDDSEAITLNADFANANEFTDVGLTGTVEYSSPALTPQT